MANALSNYQLIPPTKESIHAYVEGKINISRVFKVLDARPETTGAGVIFIDSNNRKLVLRKFKSNCRLNPITVVLREPPSHISSLSYSSILKTNDRESKMLGEIIGTGLSCGSAALAWLIVFGSSGTIPITGGSSSVITFLGYSAGLASTAQCIAGLGRVYFEAKDPKYLDWIDSQEWYQDMSTALDIISLTGAAISGAYTIKMTLMLKSTTGKTILEILKGLSRQERVKITKEIIKYDIPRISNKAFKRLLHSGYTTRRYSHPEIYKAIVTQLKDALGAGIGFTGSAFSGTVKTIAVGMYEELKFED